MGLLRRRPMSAEERARRIAEARANDRGVGVRCPGCGVHTPGLRGRRVRPAAVSMPGISDQLTAAGDHGHYALNLSQPQSSPSVESLESTRRSHRRPRPRFFRCPVCGHTWTADTTQM